MARRAFVTGASGFIGANLARRLLHEGHEVHLALRPHHNPWRVEEIRDEVRIHAADLNDPEAIDRALVAARPEWIFHLAAYGAYPQQRDLERMIETNVRGTAHLLTAAQRQGFDAFVNAGTSSEYGYKDHAPSEDELLEPNSTYAVTKAAATHLCRMSATKDELPVRTLRIYSAYGPFEEATRLVPTLIVKGLEGRLPPLVDPSVARDYVHVDDVCAAFVLAAATRDQEPGVVYNVGTGVQTTLREIVAVTRDLLGIEAEPGWGTMAERSWDTTVWVSNPERIRSRLGWSPAVSLKQGLTQTVEWFKLHAGQVDRYRAAQGSQSRS